MAYLLVVEDDIDSRDALCQYLVKAGHDVQCVSNGQEALMSILTRRPELIILDLLMPQMDGPSLLEIVRSYLRLQTIPVIVLTALGDSPMVDRVRHLKVNAILMKGKATLADVLDAVNQELSRVPT